MLTRGRLSKSTSDTDQGAFENAAIRMGPNYQAAIPDLVAPLINGKSSVNTSPNNSRGRKRRVGPLFTQSPAAKEPDRDVCLWMPMTNSEERLAKYLQAASKKYGYNEEQALAMLSWHNKNVEKALDDLANFCPMSDNWNYREKKKFFMCVRTQKKDFNRIKQMFPQRTMRELVQFYYTNKKKRSVLQSLGLYDPSRCGYLQSFYTNTVQTSNLPVLPPPGFQDSLQTAIKTEPSAEQDQFNADFERHMRQIRGTNHNSDDDIWSTGSETQWQEPTDKYALPPGTHYQHTEFLQVALLTSDKYYADMNELNDEIIQAEIRLRTLQSKVEEKDNQVLSGLDDYKPSGGLLKPTYRWTNEELLFTVQAVRKHGRDYKAIADLVGSKTEAMIKAFFNAFSTRFKLDELVAEYEKDCAFRNNGYD